MYRVIKLVSLWTVDNDQGPKTETKGGPPTQVDSEGLSYEVVENPLRGPHPEATTGPQEIVCKPSQHAHVDFQMMSEKYGRLEERYQVVSHERDAL